MRTWTSGVTLNFIFWSSYKAFTISTFRELSKSVRRESWNNINVLTGTEQELDTLFNTKCVSLSTYKSSVRCESFTRRPSESYLIVNIWSATFDRHRLLCWKCPCLHIDHLVIKRLTWKLLHGDSVLSPDVIIQGITFATITVLSYSHIRHARE